MRTLLLALAVCVGSASMLQAQDAQPSGAAPAPAVNPSSGPVNPDGLGVSIDHIRLKFRRESMFSNVFDPERLKLSSSVDVVGKAPALNLFGANAKDEFTNHAVPFGAPTHRDVLALLTPEEFRTPPMDLTSLVKWLTDHLEKDKEGK